MTTQLHIKPMSVNLAWQGKRYKTNDYRDYEAIVCALLPRLTIPDGNLCLTLEFGLNKLADALNVTEDYLIKGKESNQIDNQVLEQCIEIVAENADDLGFAEQSRLVTYLYSKAIQSNKKTTISDVTSLIRLLK